MSLVSPSPSLSLTIPGTDPENYLLPCAQCKGGGGGGEGGREYTGGGAGAARVWIVSPESAGIWPDGGGGIGELGRNHHL